MVDFLFAIIEHFSLPLTVETYKQILVEVGVFQRGWVTKRKFQVKGTSPTHLFWYQKTRGINLSCGIKIWAVCSFVSSQSMRVTDGRMELRSPRPR